MAESVSAAALLLERRLVLSSSCDLGTLLKRIAHIHLRIFIIRKNI